MLRAALLVLASPAARPAFVEVRGALTASECNMIVAHAAQLSAGRLLSRHRAGAVELTGRAGRLPWLDERLRRLAPGALGGASGELLGDLELVRVQQYSSGGSGSVARAWHRCARPLSLLPHICHAFAKPA